MAFIQSELGIIEDIVFDCTTDNLINILLEFKTKSYSKTLRYSFTLEKYYTLNKTIERMEYNENILDTLFRHFQSNKGFSFKEMIGKEARIFFDGYEIHRFELL